MPLPDWPLRLQAEDLFRTREETWPPNITFKVMHRVIQRNQPVFMLGWIGSVVVLLVSGVMDFWWLEGVGRRLLLLATAVYLLGVQVPTAVLDVPLNNRLQTQELDTLSDSQLGEARDAFEGRWIRWNAIQTVMATSPQGC